MTIVKRFIGSANVIHDYDPITGVTEFCVSGCPEFIPFYLDRIEARNFPYPIEQLMTNDYGRKLVCVRTDVYPLAFDFWKFLNDLDYLDYKAQGFVYFFLRDKCDSGVDFIPSNQLVGHWFNMVRQFIKFKFLKAIAKCRV